MTRKRLSVGDVVIITNAYFSINFPIGSKAKLLEYSSRYEEWNIQSMKRPSQTAWTKRKNIKPVDESSSPISVQESKGTYTIDEKFIQEAYKAACDKWKIKLEKKFPKVLKKEDEFLKIPTKLNTMVIDGIWIGCGVAPDGKANKCIMSITHEPIVEKTDNDEWVVSFKRIKK
jgi:hypothetical protein